MLQKIAAGAIPENIQQIGFREQVLWIVFAAKKKNKMQNTLLGTAENDEEGIVSYVK